MKIELDNTSKKMNINTTDEEIKKIYTSYDKYAIYLFIFDLLKIVGDMYMHIMSDENEISDEHEMGDEQ